MSRATKEMKAAEKGTSPYDWNNGGRTKAMPTLHFTSTLSLRHRWGWGGGKKRERKRD